jgi:hypothetical protein
VRTAALRRWTVECFVLAFIGIGCGDAFWLYFVVGGAPAGRMDATASRGDRTLNLGVFIDDIIRYPTDDRLGTGTRGRNEDVVAITLDSGGVGHAIHGDFGVR